MASSVQNDALSIPLPSRPRMMSHQSNSLPSTPRQLALDYDLGSRTPSPGRRAGSSSPRSVTSDSNRAMPALRLASAACRFMSTQTSRRRIPYTIGTELLENDYNKAQATLGPCEEEKLSGDMRELYDRLLPTPENEAKREQVLDKLRKILAEEWPGREVEVAMFGSSGNLLFTSKSDVDICVTMKDVETTCVIADALARHGMQKVTCVHAKAVPIVKIWDPELQLACDLNLNNNVALTNTRMVKTYIQLDERVRPLAMIVKYWTKRRIINEASGGTLSSYTWTLLLINFLQTRNPPVLPVLAVRDANGKPRSDFSQDLSEYRTYGAENKETLGELLFHFFRRYGHEIDYTTAVISVRNGALLTKEEKNWQLATNNMLCVEEPFNNDRNLGNTADDTAFRGLHLEFRQAFERIAEAKDIVSSVCEQFTFPSGDTKPVFFERPQPQPRPIITRSRSQSNRGGSNNASMRGNRHHSNSRSGHNGRRASSAADYGQNTQHLFPNAPILYSPTDFIIRSHGQEHQQQMQSQQGLQDQLSQLSQQLSREEQRLRAQQVLISQAQLQQAHAQVQAHAAGQNRNGTFSGRLSSSHNYRSPRAGNMEEPPATAPLQRPYHYGSQFESPGTASLSPSQQGTDTNPSSPQLTPSIPLRRNFQRAAVPTASGASVRSHSQPARSIGQSNMNSYSRPQYMMTPTSSQPLRQDFVLPNGVHGQSFIGPFLGPYGPFYIPSTSVVEHPREYLGYGYGASPQLMTGYADQILPQIPAFDDLQRQGRSSSDMQGQDNLPFSLEESSRSTSPQNNDEEHLNGLLPKVVAEPNEMSAGKSYPLSFQPTTAGPVIVNGSHASAVKPVESHKLFSTPKRRASDPFSNLGTAQSYDLESANLSNGVHQHERTNDDAVAHEGQHYATPNGVVAVPDGRMTAPWLNSVEGGLSKNASSNGLVKTAPSSPATISPTSRLSPELQHERRAVNGMSRPTINSLDFGVHNMDFLRDSIHPQTTLLSPVRETPTPSPTSTRKTERVKESAYVNGSSSGIIPPPVRSQPDRREEHAPPTPVSGFPAAGLGIGLPGKQEHRDAVALPDDRKSVRMNGSSAPLSNSASNNNNIWQLAAGKKGRKGRGITSSTAQSENRVAEPMPVNEAERKGG